MNSKPTISTGFVWPIRGCLSIHGVYHMGSGKSSLILINDLTLFLQWLKGRHKRALYESLEKIKAGESF